MLAQQADPSATTASTPPPQLEQNQLSHAKLMPWFIEPFISDVEPFLQADDQRLSLDLSWRKKRLIDQAHPADSKTIVA